jgi:hypothetical protein
MRREILAFFVMRWHSQNTPFHFSMRMSIIRVIEREGFSWVAAIFAGTGGART